MAWIQAPQPQENGVDGFRMELDGAEELSFSLLDSHLQVVVYELFKFGLLGSQRGPRLACLRARGGVGFRPATPRREIRARRTDGRRRLHSLRERQLHEDAPEVKNNKKSTHLKWILPPQGGS